MQPNLILLIKKPHIYFRFLYHREFQPILHYRHCYSIFSECPPLTSFENPFKFFSAIFFLYWKLGTQFSTGHKALSATFLYSHAVKLAKLQWINLEPASNGAVNTLDRDCSLTKGKSSMNFPRIWKMSQANCCTILLQNKCFVIAHWGIT
jgi:hypothetical protein